MCHIRKYIYLFNCSCSLHYGLLVDTFCVCFGYTKCGVLQNEMLNYGMIEGEKETKSIEANEKTSWHQKHIQY